MSLQNTYCLQIILPYCLLKPFLLKILHNHTFIICSNIYAYTCNSTQQYRLPSKTREINVPYYVTGVQVSENFSPLPKFRLTEWMLTTNHNQDQVKAAGVKMQNKSRNFGVIHQFVWDVIIKIVVTAANNHNKFYQSY